MPARTGKLGAAVAARAKPINHLWALMDERCTCRRCVRDRIGLCGFMPPLRANGGFAQGLGLA